MNYQGIEYDHCQLCHGREGGISGNENRVEISQHLTIVVCDYCDVALREWAMRVTGSRSVSLS